MYHRLLNIRNGEKGVTPSSRRNGSNKETCDQLTMAMSYLVGDG